VHEVYAIASLTDISQEWVSRFTQPGGADLPSLGGSGSNAKKLLLLLLDNLNSGSNKNLAAVH